MKKFSAIIVAILAFGFLFGGEGIRAQKSVKAEDTIEKLLEQDAKHNLNVARNAFKLKKAYKGVLMRFEETFVAHPTFSKMDEFLYYAGMSSYYLSKNEGRQKVNLDLEKEREKYAPEKLRADAIVYLRLMIEKNPETRFRDEAEKVLKELDAL